MIKLNLPISYSDRNRLNDELHARPPVALYPNEHVLYLALVETSGKRLQEEAFIRDLCDSLGGDACPLLRGNNIEFDVAINNDSQGSDLKGLRFRVKYERHSEFSSWWFFQQSPDNAADTNATFGCNLEKWLPKLPGRLLVGMNIRVCQVNQPPSAREFAPIFSGNTIVGSMVSHEGGAAFTDFKLNQDGLTRMLFFNMRMGSRQAGRMLQALVEIETYRMMALLSLPEVLSSTPILTEQEQSLIEVSQLLATQADEKSDVQIRDLELQQRISIISSSIEALLSRTQYRLSASEAYFQLVQRRISDLHESNLPDIQGFGEFMDRRLAPAMKTCSAFAMRIRETSHRVSRISQLLQTRVEIVREAQNSELLASMERRSKQQLHLQQAVEGLSIVAISYYGISLMAYIFKAMKTAGLINDSELATGIATPIILVLVGYLIRKIRNSFK